MATYKNIFGSYVVTTQSVDDEIALTSANIRVTGPLSVNGNITSTQYYFGDGQFLTNVVANIGSASKLQFGTSNIDIPVVNGNITMGINSVGNIVIWSTGGQQINANTASTNQSTGALIVAGGAGISGNVYAGGVYNNGQPVVNAVSTIDGGSY